MNFDVTVTHDARWTWIRLEGQGGVGRVLSLLQVLALDCKGWTTAAVLVDVRGLQPPLSGDEQAQLAEAAAHSFGERRVGLLAPWAGMGQVPGLSMFEDEGQAQAWLAAG